MRLFAALPVEPPAAAELATLLGTLRASGWPVRWARPEGLHLTMKFFGETDATRVEAIEQMLEVAARGTGPLSCGPVELGAFPGWARARVLWAGYEGESALELLVHRVEQGAERLGFPVEGRPFRPHVTLGRLRDGARLPDAALERLEGHRLQDGFVARRLVLYRSDTAPGGAIYAPIRTFDLEGRCAG